MPKWKLSKEYTGKGLADEDARIGHLIDDTYKIPDVVLLKGILGKSPTQDVWWLFVTYDLTEYYEVHSADIVFAEDKAGVWFVWVTRKPIRHVKTRPWSAEVEYLSGALADRAGGEPVMGFAAPDEGFGPEPTKCINGCNTKTR